MSRPIAQLKKDTRTKGKKQQAFLDAFANVASVSTAAKKSKVPRRTIYEWLAADKAFKAKYDDACTIAIAALEDEAIRRAYEGTLRPVYQGKEKVGTIREFSDTLLIFLLKGLAPEKYKDRVYNEQVGKGGGPIQTEVQHTVVFRDYGADQL